MFRKIGVSGDFTVIPTRLSFFDVQFDKAPC